MDIEECVAYALEHNITIKNTQLDEKLARRQEDGIRNFMPSVNGQASHSGTSGSTRTLQRVF
jgi:outer membrane protein